MANKIALLLLCGMLAVLPTLWAQTPAKLPEGDVLLRMERVRRDEKVCVLVDRAGSYHLERVYPAKSEVYAGTLPAAGIPELERLLAADDLRRLTQQQISSPPASDSLDQVFVAIRRPDGWQKLSFTTPEGRKPFAAFMDPLTKWFDTVSKQRPGATSTKDVPIGCGGFAAEMQLAGGDVQHDMQRSDTAVERRVASGIRAPETASQTRTAYSSGGVTPFVMRIALEHVANGHTTRTCATVYPDLRYHLERSEQIPSFQLKPKVYESSITGEQLQELRKLLDAPELRTLEHNNLPNGVAVREADFTVLSVGRSSGVQNLAFASYFGIQNNRRDTSQNAANSRYSTDEDVKLVKPVRKWLKDAIESRKTPEIKNTVATDCVP